MAWLDNTGLNQKFGLEQTVPQAGGEYLTYGDVREIEFKITLSTLTASDTIVSGADNIFIPANVMIEQVEVITDVAAVSGGATTLDIGLIRTDRTTAVAATGLVAAAAKTTIDTIGKKQILNLGSTGAGTLVGAATVGTNPTYLTAKANVANFSAGVVTVRIKYRKP